ncbi:MAG TPA: hypothetical protein G4O02_18175 [Caldilineae bacterium]|nr:hypothetical protein [Caldilineae bacterium]
MRLLKAIPVRVRQRAGLAEPATIWWREDRLPVIAVEARGRIGATGAEWFIVRTSVGKLRLLHRPERGWFVTAAPWWLLLPSWLIRPAQSERRFDLPWQARRRLRRPRGSKGNLHKSWRGRLPFRVGAARP